ncbi:hypothetical protein ACTXT7_002320 [Hymenolepis weldensis]
MVRLTHVVHRLNPIGQIRTKFTPNHPASLMETQGTGAQGTLFSTAQLLSVSPKQESENN